MSPFVPVGAEARWRTIYGLLADTPVGEVLTYEAIAEALKLDPLKDRHTIQVAMRRAGRELEEQNGHAVDAVKNTGYQVVDASGHLNLARRQQKRSNNALASGNSKVVNVDLTGVDPEIQKAFQVMASAFSMQMEFNRRTDVRQKRLEQSLQSVVKQTAKTDEELAELRARLERLEDTKHDTTT